jgi:hypothetical protein
MNRSHSAYADDCFGVSPHKGFSLLLENKLFDAFKVVLAGSDPHSVLESQVNCVFDVDMQE